MTTVTSTSDGRLSRWVPPLLVLAMIASIVMPMRSSGAIFRNSFG